MAECFSFYPCTATGSKMDINGAVCWSKALWLQTPLRYSSKPSNSSKMKYTNLSCSSVWNENKKASQSLLTWDDPRCHNCWDIIQLRDVLADKGKRKVEEISLWEFGQIEEKNNLCSYSLCRHIVLICCVIKKTMRSITQSTENIIYSKFNRCHSSLKHTKSRIY